MYLESQQISDVVNDLAAVSCGELFADYSVALERCHCEWTEGESQQFCSVMGFVSESIRGCCLLACEQGPLETSCPKGGRPRDWIGELANQLVGRLKVKLLAYDVEVALTTPVVLQGVRLRPLPKVPLDPVMFTCSSGSVLIWTEVEVASGYSLPAPRPAEAGEVGELMLF